LYAPLGCCHRLLWTTQRGAITHWLKEQTCTPLWSIVLARELPTYPSDSTWNPSEWTQVGLAQKVGASVRSVKAWEAGDAVPRPFYRRRLAKVLGVSITDLGF
jgi:DNA-binding XRE family transcriptional regulator